VLPGPAAEMSVHAFLQLTMHCGSVAHLLAHPSGCSSCGQ
jgi:hypothetical protein